jgi:hypothetical protein
MGMENRFCEASIAVIISMEFLLIGMSVFFSNIKVREHLGSKSHESREVGILLVVCGAGSLVRMRTHI